MIDGVILTPLDIIETPGGDVLHAMKKIDPGFLSFEEAYMLMSGTVDVQICQCCEPGEFPTTARAVLNKALIS